ncbi:MAG: N-acetylmuramoyl-L-alanine amidase [Phycisphaerae bacterium]|nr:N-acetylmuramoyl-L-alanine amidase [Phycisphaerae bacterium]
MTGLRGIHIFPAICLAAIVLAGCDTHKKVGPDKQSVQPANTLSVQEFAKFTGLTITKSTPMSAELTSNGVRVVVYVDPNGWVGLNGRRVGPIGGVVNYLGILYVPLDTVIQVRQLLAMGSVPVNPLTPIPTNPNGSHNPPPPVGPPYPTNPINPTNPPVRVSGRIVIDPGHGGKDPGTHGAGLTEKSVNLAVALGVAGDLRLHGVDVVITRRDDTFVDLTDRIAVANNWKADAFVCIHTDYSKNGAAVGHSILLPRGDSGRAARLANLISRNLASIGSPSYSIRRDDRNLCVLRNARVTAVLVEMGFLSHPADAARLGDSGFQSKIATAISDGIVQYLQGK